MLCCVAADGLWVLTVMEEQRLQRTLLYINSIKNYQMDDVPSTCLTLQAMSLLTEQPPSELAFSCRKRANERNLS